MKLFILSIAFLCSSIAVTAQTPVKWEFSAKKINDLQYEINMVAMVDFNWHIYSQSSPKGGPVATKFSFQKNPLLVLKGPVKEEGKMHQKYDDVFELQVKYYDNKVVFKQIVTLKRKIKTTFSGTVEYMLCDDKQCMPPTTEAFNISL